MYTQFFNLKQSPFSIAPDPRYLFMSERHREALAHLLYGVGSGGGFVLLTGEIGAGKTTVCRCFMEQIPENCKLAYIFNPKLTVEELLQSICEEFGVEQPGANASVKHYVDAINAYLLASHAAGRNSVLIIDEAQNLSAEVLEQLRLLTNLETNERKLLQIILIGQPELRQMLARPELEQLAQRVMARYHLGSLTESETASYIAHRLAVAGAAALAPFPRPLVRLIHRLSKGVPRRINLLCDRALLGAYVENRQQVSTRIVRRAAAEVFADGLTLNPPPNRAMWRYVLAGVAGGLALGAVAWGLALRGGPAGSDRAAPPVAVRAASQPASRSASPAVAAGTQPAPVAPQAAAHASADAGLRELAALWGATLPAGEPCQAALALNLRCYQSRGGIDELRLLDRPVLLTLNDDPTRPTYALLTALGDGTATLRQGGKDSVVTTAALAARFDGAYTTFWRAPRGWRDEVGVGDRGPDVDWLAKRLAQLNDLKKPADNQPLDATMQRLLREFQLRERLKADGVAGPKTFIRLIQLGASSEPRLLAVAAGK
jgi:general secretion pathway protein A